MSESVTPKELELVKKIVDHNEYGEKGCLDNSPWSWAVCGTKSQGAVLGSLINKGFAKQQGKGNDAVCYLTTQGKKLYLKHFGAEGVWSNELEGNEPPTDEQLPFAEEGGPHVS